MGQEAIARCNGNASCANSLNFSGFADAARLKENGEYFDEVADAALPILGKRKETLDGFDVIEIKRCSRYVGAGSKAHKVIRENGWY